MERFNNRPFNLHRASLEGNIRVPQNALGITTYSAEQCLTSEDPLKAIEHLADPIPFDEKLEERTRKANAQHALHNIPKQLSASQVRDIELQGNLHTINLLGSMLGRFDHLGDSSIWSQPETGDWATPEVRNRIETIKQQLDPATILAMKELLASVTETLNRADVKELLAARKAAYKSHVGQNELQRANAEVARLTNEVIQEVITAVYEEGERGSSAKKRMAMNLMMTIRSYAPKF